MMVWSKKILVLSLCCLVVVGCAPWRDRYFDGGVGELTQDDIKEKLGKPHQVKDPLLSDETVWKYRFALTESELDPWGIKTLGLTAKEAMGSAGTGPKQKIYCYVYILSFDKEKVLRQWERVLCEVPKPPDPFTQGLSG